MTRVRKYSLGTKGGRVAVLDVPIGTKWLSASIQLDVIYLYGIETDTPRKKRKETFIRIAATDTDLDAGLPPGKFNSFICTVTQGPLVYHLFEELDESTRNLSTT